MSQASEPFHPAAADPSRLKSDCEVIFTRRSGPGGQNRNKVETAVVLRHRPTGLVAEANERRSQAENLKEALFRLRLLLALEVRRELSIEHAPRPGATWLRYARGDRIAIHPRNDDFPTLLSEALDAVYACGLDLKAAAEALGCSTSQLVKLLKDEPRALRMVNEARKIKGLRPYL